MTCGVEYANPSFKSIEFEAGSMGHSGGHRIINNLYPFTDFHYNEYLGKKPERFAVSGFFHGEDFRDKLNLAQRIWNIGGNGIFFEPTQNKNHNVILADWDFSYPDKTINRVDFTLALIEKGDRAYPNQLQSILAQINGLVDDFIATASSVYGDIMGTVGQFNDVFTGFNAATSFVGNTARQTVSTGFPSVVSSINTATPARTAPANAQTVIAIFETAAANNAPVKFFKQNSELRINSNSEVMRAQVNLVAAISYAYYFEKIAPSMDYAELRDFRERGQSLKLTTTDETLISKIDGLIVAAGTASSHVPIYEIDGTQNALVASYELYGNIDRASRIVALSGGVSGAAMVGVLHE